MIEEYTRETEKLNAPDQLIERVPLVVYWRAITTDRQVVAYLLVTLGLIFGGVQYFSEHGTDAQALIAALFVGSFIWAAFRPTR